MPNSWQPNHQPDRGLIDHLPATIEPAMTGGVRKLTLEAPLWLATVDHVQPGVPATASDRDA